MAARRLHVESHWFLQAATTHVVFTSIQVLTWTFSSSWRYLSSVAKISTLNSHVAVKWFLKRCSLNIIDLSILMFVLSYSWALLGGLQQVSFHVKWQCYHPWTTGQRAFCRNHWCLQDNGLPGRWTDRYWDLNGTLSVIMVLTVSWVEKSFFIVCCHPRSV